MKKKEGNYYISTAIAYASGKPHIGNTYEIILADSIARYKRQQGFDVYFQTGSDEHGQKIQLKAEAAGQEPKTYVDGIVSQIKAIWDRMNTSYDRFIRTTDADHEAAVRKIVKKMFDNGDIYKGYYEGLYCTDCEAFFTPSQLVNGKCPDCGRDVHPAKEEAYFFKMSKYADRLIEYINTHPDFIRPVSRKNEMMNNFLLPGLQDLCISRTSFTWGIPVDFAPGHVIYVWLDALANYITGIGYDPDGSSEKFEKFWPADLHLIGKDIIRFHTIYWPIFLMALGLPLPKQVFGHPWLLQGGDKMSKSKGNVIYADDLADLFGVDAVRYFVLHEMPFDNDGTITWELVVERINSDLANILGNLVNRTISMTNKYFGGIVSNPKADEEVDKDLKAVVSAAAEKVENKMDELRVADALTEIFAVFRRLNKYIDETMPWVLARDEEKKDRLATVLYNLTEGITIGASLLAPFMPETCEKILAQLNTQIRSYEDLDSFGLYPEGNKVTEKPEILFARQDLKEVLAKAEEIKAAQKAAYAAANPEDAEKEEEKPEEEADIHLEAGETASYDDFAKLTFAVGEIISCEAVKKSKKLLCSQVKIGDQVRQILSGIRTWYSPEEMVGKKVMVLVNLAPKQMAGLTSEGMILCAEDDKGNLSLMVPEKDLKAGSGIS
ncbi:MAG: methionine--tRNA ligase [Eubacterium sp.]|nr:methionine--tRNA ligase [Eubacterium sp.]